MAWCRAAQAELQQELEEKLEAERQKRVEHTMNMAMHRIVKRDLTRGWLGWLDAHRERQRVQRLLAASASKMRRPKLVACFREWLGDFLAEQQAQQTKRLGAQLSREV